jgi:glucose/arabinose dehydrogenase
MKAGLRLTMLALTAGVLLALPAQAGAVALQPIGTFNQPIYVTSDPVNPDRLFVVQRQGQIKEVKGGSVSTFADLTSVVQCCESERGLLSMALAPDFPQSGLFYVDYTGKDGPGNLHVAELKADANGAGLSTLRNVITISHSQAANHNGGQLQFGPDGFLYISTGDGGSTPQNGQDKTSLLGKILRIDPKQSGSQPYSVPASNPFVGAPGADEIWAYGLRNPYRFSFDRSNGDLLIGDVGQDSYEEVDLAPASQGGGRGLNFGWASCEGYHNYPSGTAGCTLPGHTDPIFEYPHAFGLCAITGGYVVRDPSLGALYGRYIWADYCVGQLDSFAPGLPAASGNRYEGTTFANPVSFGEDSCGRLYAVEQGGNVFRFTGSGGLACKVLKVTSSGTGKGTVTGPGIDCPPDCSQVFPLPSSVSLKSHPGKHSNFAGWGGACGGKKDCSISMSADRTVNAKFKGPLITRLRLRAPDRTVADGASALLKVKAKPCDGRRHDRVRLLRSGKRVAAKRLNGKCVATFHPRIEGRDQFRARIRADKQHRAGKSRNLTIVGH